jgi:hypothetical protein
LSSVFEGIHFTVENGAGALDPSVVAPTDDGVAVDDDGTNGNAAFLASLAGFVDRGPEKWIFKVHDRGSEQLRKQWALYTQLEEGPETLRSSGKAIATRNTASYAWASS